MTNFKPDTTFNEIARLQTENDRLRVLWQDAIDELAAMRARSELSPLTRARFDRAVKEAKLPPETCIEMAVSTWAQNTLQKNGVADPV